MKLLLGINMMMMMMMMMMAGRSTVRAADPDPVQDFCVTDADQAQKVFINGLPCKDPANVTAADFKSSLLRRPADPEANPFGVGVVIASAANFGGLNTQGLTVARLDFAAGGVLPPHVHPRASEAFLLVKGRVSVGFVDGNNVLYAQTLFAGDLFIFPRGLAHYILNVGTGPALAYASLNSQNPGVSLLNLNLFASHPPIPDAVLKKSFALSPHQLQAIRKAFTGPA